MVPVGKQVSEKAAPVVPPLGVTERGLSASWCPHGLCTPCVSETQLGGRPSPCLQVVLGQKCEAGGNLTLGLLILKKLVFEGPGHPFK